MFLRSVAGLRNQHLFYGVDYVVYCEGGESSGDTHDEFFWGKVLGDHGVKCVCKSSGSKTALAPLIRRILQGTLVNTIVAMDLDYDDLLERRITHPRIIYSYGYSWESDVVFSFNLNVAAAVFGLLANTEALQRDFCEYRKKISSELRRVTAVDFKYIQSNMALFDRSKPLSIVDSTRNCQPRIATKRIVECACKMPKFQSARIDAKTYRALDGFRRFFGKTVAKLVYIWLYENMKRQTKTFKIGYDAFMRLLISTTVYKEENSDRGKYYTGVIAQIT